MSRAFGTPTSRRLFPGVIVAVALSLAACGTTVQGAGSNRGSNDLSLGGNGASAGPGGGATAGTGPLGTGTAPGTGPGSVPTDGSSVGGGAASLPSGNVVSSNSAAPLLIGVVDEKNAGTGDAALGAQNSDPGNFKADYNAIIKYINAHGGIAGHPLQPVFANFDATSSDSISTQEQRACNTWTHDHHVFAILVGQSDLLKTCAARAGIVQLSIEESSTDSTGFARYPALVEITAVGLDREGPVTVNGLNKLGYFRGVTSKQLGIVTWDLPPFHHAVDHGYLPALHALGLDVSSTHRRYLHVPDTASDVGATSNDARAAAFKFAQDGVTNVLILDGHAGIATGGVVHLEFMLNAETLHYRPRYGLNETAAYSAGAGTYPKQQQHNAVGVAWSPGADGSSNPDPGSPWANARVRCIKIFQDAGINASTDNADANLIGICDEIFFMQVVASRVSGPLSTASFINSVARLGSAYQTAGTYATSFAGRRDGASRGRTVHFVDSCTCYQYVGPFFQV
jgi:predicted small secreted protein